jgi:hypothetical protein
MVRRTHLRAGNVDLSDAGPTLRIDGEDLIVTIDGPVARRKIDALLPYDLQARVSGTLEGGATFELQHLSKIGQNSVWSKADGVRADLGFKADHWTLLGDAAPSIWAGKVEGVGDISHGGNLIVERIRQGRPTAGRRGHFCLRGNYAYYLVRQQTTDDWWLVVDTEGAGLPDWELLGRDILILQFAFGRQCRAPLFVGLKADRVSVACTALRPLRNKLEERSHLPVPIDHNNETFLDETWLALLFERISGAWSRRPEVSQIFWLALDMYLDSMRNYLDADYMCLHIALESLGYALLKRGDEKQRDTKDWKAWKEWVNNNEPAIRVLATEGRENALVNKVMGAGRQSSGQVVPRAFKEFGLVITDEMEKELDGRNFIVHQGLMSPEGYDVDRDLGRVSLVRTMLVALLARAAGYRGAINGWAVGRRGLPVEPPGAWWPIDDADRAAARVLFLAEEAL